MAATAVAVAGTTGEAGSPLPAAPCGQASCDPQENDGRCLVTQLPGVLLVTVCSYLSYQWQSLERYSVLCRSFQERFDQDAVWQHLCNDFWFVTEQRLKEWPALRSYRALYRLLEQWAALEGFYTLPAAFPWCLLVLVRFEAGVLVAEAIRFCNSQTNGQMLETRVRLFEVTFEDADCGQHGVRASVRFPADVTGQLSGGATLAPLPATVPSILAEALQFEYGYEVVPRWIAASRGLCVQVAPEASDHAGTAPDGGDAGAGAGVGAPATEFLERLSTWVPRARLGAIDSEDRSATALELLEARTATMVMQLLEASRSLTLALVRSPADCALADDVAPRLHPGLYVGDYAHAMYGQFRHEVLLVEHRECGREGLEALFARPFEGGGVPSCLTATLEAAGYTGEPTGFLVGTKVTGDVHVPAGQATFVALCSPPALSASLEQARGLPIQQVVNRSSGAREDVLRSWPGYGTLATFGFGNPSWAPGWLVQLRTGRDGDRFGFVWSRNQDAVVLEYVQAQQSCPFLSRKWLPEALR